MNTSELLQSLCLGVLNLLFDKKPVHSFISQPRIGSRHSKRWRLFKTWKYADGVWSYGSFTPLAGGKVLKIRTQWPILM